MTEKGRTNRQKIQDYAVYLSKNFKHVVLSWGTGMGKSLAALMIIHKHIEDNPQDYKLWYIVCAERQHVQNWKDEMKKHNLQYLLDQGYVEIFCYQSLDKYKGKKRNLVLDEAHSVTNLRLDILQTIKDELIVSLSATLPIKRSIQLSQLGQFREYTITLDQGIKAGILPQPKYVEVNVDLTPEEVIEYQGMSDLIAFKENELNNISTFASGLVNVRTNLTNEILKLKVKRKGWVTHRKTKQARLIGNILDRNSKRYICFCGTLTQATWMGKPYNEKRSITSKTTQVNNDRILEQFNKGEINSIFVNKMLRQGTNLSNIEAGIIVQLDNQELTAVQMVGRILRSQEPIVFILLVNNTIDENYWNKCKSNIDPSHIITYKQYLDEQETKGNQEDTEEIFL